MNPQTERDRLAKEFLKSIWAQAQDGPILNVDVFNAYTAGYERGVADAEERARGLAFGIRHYAKHVASERDHAMEHEKPMLDALAAYSAKTEVVP